MHEPKNYHKSLHGQYVNSINRINLEHCILGWDVVSVGSLRESWLSLYRRNIRGCKKWWMWYRLPQIWLRLYTQERVFDKRINTISNKKKIICFTRLVCPKTLLWSSKNYAPKWRMKNEEYTFQNQSIPCELIRKTKGKILSVIYFRTFTIIIQIEFESLECSIQSSMCSP